MVAVDVERTGRFSFVVERRRITQNKLIWRTRLRSPLLHVSQVNSFGLNSQRGAIKHLSQE